MTPVWLAGLLVLSAAGPQRVNFSNDTEALAPGRVTMGALAPTRVGLADGLELMTQPWLLPVSPNLAVRVTRSFPGGFSAGVGFGAHVPTFALGLLAREGPGGLLPPTTTVPLLVVVDPAGYIAYDVGPWLWVSASGRLRFAFGASEDLPLIELPFVLPRTAPYTGGWGAQAELAMGGPMLWGFGWRAELEGFAGPVDGARWALEPEVALRYSPWSWLRLSAGTRFFVGEMPYGLYVSTPVPFVDAEIGFDVGPGS
jgi:hypothetical protein